MSIWNTSITSYDTDSSMTALAERSSVNWDVNIPCGSWSASVVATGPSSPFANTSVADNDDKENQHIYRPKNEISQPRNMESYILSETLREMESGIDKGLNFTQFKAEVKSTIAHVSPPYSPKSKFYVIKSYNQQDVLAALKHHCWSSTNLGNKRLDKAYKQAGDGNIYLFFSVNGSGRFCAVAQMIGPVDFDKDASCWSDPKWKGSFPVQFIYVKDVENKYFKSMNIEMIKNGERCISSVVTSRDTQQLPADVGKAMMKIFDLKDTSSYF